MSTAPDDRPVQTASRIVAILSEHRAEEALLEIGRAHGERGSVTRSGDGWQLTLRDRTPAGILRAVTTTLDRHDPLQQRTYGAAQPDALADAVTITEERRTVLDTLSRRVVAEHSVTLHRDATSVADLAAMLEQLRAQGVPEEATLRCDATTGHTRLWARWALELP